MSVLLLGGTGEARELAALLVEAGVPVVSSLAGAVSRPRLPVGSVRVGGFGGVDGLRVYLRQNGIGAVVDATHPFAATISANAARACAASGVPLLRLERPGWAGHPDAGSWHWAAGHRAAAALAAGLGHRVLVTTGRQHLHELVEALGAHEVLARVVDEPTTPVPPGWRLRRDRGPYTRDGELTLMRSHGTEVLLTKDSGGAATAAKLEAARVVGAAVVVVRRPGPGTAWAPPSTPAPADALAWVREVLSAGSGRRLRR